MNVYTNLLYCGSRILGLVGVGEGGKVIGNGRKGYLHKLHMPHSGISRISAMGCLR